MKTLIQNAKIYDGTGKEPYVGSILVDDETIVATGDKADELAKSGVDKTEDLDGLSVGPGFIDAHSHNDWFAIKKEPEPYFEPFIRQGITSFITGNCGLSTTGFETENENVDKLGGGLFFYNNTTGKYGTTDEYFKAIDKHNPCNIALLIGHCSARTTVSGYANRKLDEKEEKEMLEIIDKALEQGACGVSLGMMYEPGLYADVDELKKVAALCIKHNKPLTVHPRANSAVSMSYPELFGRSHILRALDELVEVAKGTKLKLQYSHAIFVGRKSFKDKDELVEIIHNMRKEGVDAGFDIYHACLGVSVITVILPTWYQGMSEEERNKPINKLKLKVLVAATSKLLGFGFNDIQIAYIGEGYEEYEGKTVHEIAEKQGKKDLETYLDLCKKSNFKGRVNMGPYSTPEIISDLSKDDNCLYMTDAWIEEHGIQNPSSYDCFPKFLRASLLGTGDTMPLTVRKMSGAIADRFMLENRGYIKEGCFADLTVFDEKALKAATPDQSKSFGINRVYINGRKVLANEVMDYDALKNAGHAMKVMG